MDAKQNAKLIVENAKKQASHIINEEEIKKQAKKQASQIILNAKIQAAQLRKNTNKYVMDLLSKIEIELNKSTQNIKNAFNEIKNIIKKSN